MSRIHNIHILRVGNWYTNYCNLVCLRRDQCQHWKNHIHASVFTAASAKAGWGGGRVGGCCGGGVITFLALATMLHYAMRSSLALAPTFHATLWDLLHLHPRFISFHATLRDLLLHLHPRFMLRYETFHATLWDLLLHLHLEQEIQRIDVWPSTCSTLSKFHVQTQLWVPTLESAWQVGERKQLKYFFTDDLQNTWENTVKF